MKKTMPPPIKSPKASNSQSNSYGMFVTPEDMVVLTGIRTGRGGKTREQRQVEALKSMKIPHYVNAANKPVVARAVIEGASRATPQVESWEPALAVVRHSK